MGLVEEVERRWDSRGNVKMMSESSLTLVARLDVPMDVGIEVRPPETV
jgi:hypothetical protein